MNVMLLAIALFSPAFSASAQMAAQDAAFIEPQQEVAPIETAELTPVFEEVSASEEISAPVAPVAAIVDNTKISDLEDELAQKEEVIEKLSLHLESALKRLNSCKGLEATPSKVSAVLAAKDMADKKARKLEGECNELKSQLNALQKEKQLLDLENRQLFHALNGVQRPGRAASQSVYSKTHTKSKDVVAYPSY